MKHQRIAIVYDWMDKWGGVERVLLTLHELFPEATFYTSYYDEKTATWAKDFNIKTSFIQKLPNFVKKSRVLSLLLYPYAFESFDFSKYDLVISVTSSFAKGIITRPETQHICYLLTPTRYLWLYPEEYLKNSFQKTIGGFLLHELRKWDFIAAQRPDKYIGIANIIAQRCKSIYKRPCEMIYPPFDWEYWNSIQLRITNYELQITKKFEQLKSKKYFLVVSRLEQYKKIDLAIQTFNSRKDETLVIVGKGSQKEDLQKIAGENIIFIEHVTDEELGLLYQNAQALIMCQEEDFGYVSLEAQFFGCPVIAYGKAGALETVIRDQTGLFFNQQTEYSLCKALDSFHMMSYNLTLTTEKHGKEHLKKFSKEKFKEEFLNQIEENTKF